jgi:hypothetical protein
MIRSAVAGADRRPRDGFVLPLVVIIGLILLVGDLATLARSFGGLLGAIRQEQAGQAREIAETGLARTVGRLNRQWPYLLINCYAASGTVPGTCSGTWANPALPSAICPGHSSVGFPPVTGTTSQPGGRFRIDAYTFNGTQFYGRIGKIKVIGERLGSDGTTVVASAMVEEEFDVKPKNCDARYGQPATSSGFPGLLGWGINLGGNDVRGRISGNVMCITCTREADLGANSQSIVDGNKFWGPISVPPVPTFPSYLSATEQAITGSTTITAGSTNGGMCAVDTSSNPPITHCRISSINLSGQKLLTVDSAVGPVRLYVSGDISASGQAGIIHNAGSNTNPSPGNLGIFGKPLSTDPACMANANCTSQTVSLAGVSKPAKAANLFGFFPDARVGINGGAQGTAVCDSDGECGGGDIYGAIWAKNWNLSNSNNAQLVVPRDMADILLTNYGSKFAISVRDYVGLGVNSWRGFQGF